MDKIQYILCHKDIPTALITLNRETSALLSCEIINSIHAPLGHTDNKAFSNWLQRRAIPAHQHNQDILKGDNTNFAYMIENLGLSLIDCYWLKPINSDYSWKDVSLFRHSFAEKDFSFIGEKDCISVFKPSATTQGELQKRWVIKNGERYLVKGNYGNMYRQSINEATASLLHQKQNFDHTHYDLIELPTTLGAGIGCISKDFATEELEFVPAYDVTFYGKQNNDISVLQHYLNVCIEKGIDKETIEQWMDYQILSDFLLTNTDRHLLNLGILRNPDTLEFIKPAPIFDTGNALFYNSKYNADTILNIPITSFYKTELKMLDNVKNRMVLDLSKLPTREELFELYSIDEYSAIYFENLWQGFEKKIELIEAFQKGYSLNSRSSNFYLNFQKEDKDIDDVDDLT